MFKVKENLKEIYEYQTDPDYVNDSLTDIRNKLTELEDTSRRNNTRIDVIAEEIGKFNIYLVKSLVYKRGS